MKKSLAILVLLITMASLAGCKYPATPLPPTAEVFKPCSGPSITFGEISDDPNEVTTSKLPFANYLAGQLKDFGFECGKIKVVDTIDEMVTLINNGEVDIYMDSLYPAMLVSNATGAQPILRRWRNCDPEYYSVLFTTSNQGIESIKDLAGHMVAMDQIYSTSGFVLPAAYLIDHGMNLAIKNSYDDPVNENEVGIYFSLDDKNTLNLILEGKVVAGATDDYYFNKWQQETQELNPPISLIKLAETSPVSRQVVLVRPGLGSEVQNAIRDKLANAHLDPTGLSTMEQDADTCKYDDTPDGINEALSQMHNLHTKIIEISGWQEAFTKDQ